MHDVQVHAAVAEAVEPDLEAESRVDQRASVLVGRLQGPQLLDQQLADLFDIAPVLDAHRNREQLVGVVLGEVLEVLVEEVAVREGHHTAVQGRQLRALVVDALHLAAHAVTLYIIAHAQAAGHELNPVEEVVQHILHRETDTRRESGGNQFQGRCRDLQVVQYDDEIEAPEGDGDEVVAQRQVYLAGLNLILAGFTFRFADTADAEQGPEQIDEVSEQEI